MQEFDFNKTPQVIHATKANAKSPVSYSKYIYNVSKIETIKEGQKRKNLPKSLKPIIHKNQKSSHFT